MRSIPPCPELAREFRHYAQLQKFFDSLEPCQQEQINQSIFQAKKKATRKRRATQAAERLMEVMEAERELPPLIRTALARNLDARRGWDLMPASLRRKYLLGILHSRYPETRKRTLAYALEEFARVAGVASKSPIADYSDSMNFR